MNERIKELAAKAYLSVNPGPDPYNEAEAAWLGFGPFERKFAELIVEERKRICKQIAQLHDALSMASNPLITPRGSLGEEV